MFMGDLLKNHYWNNTTLSKKLMVKTIRMVLFYHFEDMRGEDFKTKKAELTKLSKDYVTNSQLPPQLPQIETEVDDSMVIRNATEL